MVRRVLSLLLLLLLMVGPAAALTAEVGETWIRWEWGAYGNDTLVIVDGISQGSAERGMYYLSGVQGVQESPRL